MDGKVTVVKNTTEQKLELLLNIPELSKLKKEEFSDALIDVLYEKFSEIGEIPKIPEETEF